MSKNRQVNSIMSKGTLIQCLGDFKNKKIISNSFSDHLLSHKTIQSLPIIEGHLISYKTNKVIVQGGMTKELLDFQVVAIAKKSLCITILLEGKLDFAYDDLNFSLTADKLPKAVVVNLAKPVSFRRTLYKENKVSKLNLILPYEWLDNCIKGDDNISEFITRHLINLELNLNEIMLSCSTNIIKLSSPSNFFEQMKLDTLIQTLLFEVFKQMNQAVSLFNKPNDLDNSFQADSFDPILNKLISYIESNLDEEMPISHLADFVAMSVSNLQHKFKCALGLSIRNYIRRRRLYLAKNQLESGMISISEAAYNAGYRHPSNFTSAFKKIFGFPPQTIVEKLSADREHFCYGH